MGYITKKILLWLIANAVLPIVFPAFFLAIIAWIKDGSFPLIQLTVQLLQEGFYVFSALTLVFSLYEDYDLTKRCVTPSNAIVVGLNVSANILDVLRDASGCGLGILV